METSLACPFCAERVLGYTSVEGHVVLAPCGHAEPVRREGSLAAWLDEVRATVRA